MAEGDCHAIGEGLCCCLPGLSEVSQKLTCGVGGRRGEVEETNLAATRNWRNQRAIKPGPDGDTAGCERVSGVECMRKQLELPLDVTRRRGKGNCQVEIRGLPRLSPKWHSHPLQGVASSRDLGLNTRICLDIVCYQQALLYHHAY